MSNSQSTARSSRIVSTNSSHVSPRPTITPDLVTALASMALARASSSSD